MTGGRKVTDEDRWEKLRRIIREELESAIERIAQAKPSRSKIKFTNGKWEGVSDEVLEALRQGYPAVDVERQLREMAAYLVTNPENAPRSNYGSFINRWLAKHQNQASLRSIPTKQDFQPRKLCAYCEQVSTGMVNGLHHCRSHVMDAMDEKPVPRMRGVEAKRVAGD